MKIQNFVSRICFLVFMGFFAGLLWTSVGSARPACIEGYTTFSAIIFITIMATREHYINK